MKKHQREGYVSIVCLFIGMSIIALTLSVMTLHMNDYQLQQSSGNRIRAQYLAESGMDLTLHQLYEWSEDAIEDLFLVLLQDSDAIHHLDDYLYHHMIHQVNSNKQYLQIDLNGMYAEYAHDHGMNVIVRSSVDKTLRVKVHGYYDNARVYLEGVVQMPAIVVEIGEGGTEMFMIKSLYLKSLVQSYPEA